jgi:hypothetical protein
MWISTSFLLLALAQHDHSTPEPDTAPGFLVGLKDVGPHMKVTPLREPKEEDRKRADEMVKRLRKALEKYADHEAALREGYRIFLPRAPLPEHHFTNYAYAAREAFELDVGRPSSLLYRRKGGDYQLAGAMFSAPLGAGLEELDRRVPLSVAQWHLHTNVCLPPEGRRREMSGKNPRFGASPRASIATEAECSREGGRFHHVLFGWMVHVYPFEEDPEAVFRHPGHHDAPMP